MATRIPTPGPAQAEKQSPGISDVICKDGVYKFLGATIVSLNMSLGFNGTASSCSITLVEDTIKGDIFAPPPIPSIFAISLPQGGVGKPIIYQNGIDLNPDSFLPTNVPFYFSGICTNYNIIAINTSGRTISVNLVDPRELLTGIQCLLNGFALTQNIGVGLALNLQQPNIIQTFPTRFEGVENVIDIFGYYNYGMDSQANNYGLQWYLIQEAIEAVRVKINNIWFEFVFTGDTFTGVPNWYRIPDSVADLISLCQKVALDSGSDMLFILRKVDDLGGVVEIRGVRRTNTNPLTQGQIQIFIDDRKDIVNFANLGKEYRNEPTSSIVVGGMRNKMYTACPSTYDSSMHLSSATIIDFTYTDFNGVSHEGHNAFASDDIASITAFLNELNSQGYPNLITNAHDGMVEDYNKFPADIKARLFGTSGTLIGAPVMNNDPSDGSPLTQSNIHYNVSPGAIFPLWGFTPDDFAYPFAEPFLPLDHLLFTRSDINTARVVQRIPACKIDVEFLPVRAVPHDSMFLDYDGESDYRPFAYLSDIIQNANVLPQGYMRGLPLNTEVLRAALVSQLAFESLYTIYYPDIANDLGMSYPRFDLLLNYVQDAINNDGTPDLVNGINICNWIFQSDYISATIADLNYNTDGSLNKTDFPTQQIKQDITNYGLILSYFRNIIYEQVHQYALDNLGKYLVCLPRSLIMNRIWAGLPVPTRPLKPDIEYVLDNRGYFEELNPGDLNYNLVYPPNTDGTWTTGDQYDQVRRRFMAEDGRFFAMAVFKWKPEGNINFNSNGINKAMFQDLPVSDFRPNKIAQGNPDFIYVACNASTLTKRPDLALVEVPTMYFDPLDGSQPAHGFPFQFFNEFLATKKGLVQYFNYFRKTDDNFRKALKLCADFNHIPFGKYSSDIINEWIDQVYINLNQSFGLSMATEIVADMDRCLLPLTSTWVSYGPWYSTNAQAEGMVRVDVDQNLVPWNFVRPLPSNTPSGAPWDYNLNAAGQEKLTRSLCPIDYLDSASIGVVGFPELGPADQLGFNSNLTGISVEFGINNVRSVYNFATYNARPGTFRKGDYDNVSIARFDAREKLPQPLNENITSIINPPQYGSNRFPD